MPKQKIIAVLGATGAQGGGLVRAVLSDPGRSFSVRAITRDARSPRATQLAARGADVVTADIDNPDALARAFDGAYAAYCVTFFWDHFSPEKELAQAAAQAVAARKAGVQHLIWSTLEDTREWVPLNDNRMPTLMARYKVPHFDAKGEANRFFTDAGLPVTFLLTSFYWENFIHFGMGPRRGADGVLALTLPMGDRKLPGIAAEDIGRCAYGIFQQGGSYIGRTVGIAGEHLTGAEMAASFTKALRREVRYKDVSPEAYRGLGFPGSEDLGNMFQFKRDFNQVYCAARSTETARKLNPALQTFDKWLAQNAARIPLEQTSAGA